VDTLRKPLLVPLFFAIGGCQVWQGRDIDSLPPTASLPEQSEPGQVNIRYWMDIPGAEPSALTELTRYPDNPDNIETLNTLQQTQNRADYYGAMAQGFITPPRDGLYRFFVSGDDQVEFWLSDSQTPDGATKIATVPAWTYPDDYEKYSSQGSAAINLEAGKRYYFQIIFKERYGDDHFAVAWEGPSLSRQVVPASAISSWAQPSYPSEEDAVKAYNRGYRIGYFDAQNGLSMNPQYPPLDEDQDGLYDNWETFHGLNPNDPEDASSDRDDDFLTALEEFDLGTNAERADTDGDGIPDGAEFAYNLDPLAPNDAGEDADGDGATNLEEYQQGTDLNDSEDVPVASQAMIDGFVGQYYVGKSFQTLATYRVEDSVNHDWASSSPLQGLPEDNFSVRWNGVFTAPHDSGTREYEFIVRTDDGVRLYLDNNLVIDSWVNRAAATDRYAIALDIGESVPIKMEYFDSIRLASAQLTIVDQQTGDQISQSANVDTPDPGSESSQDSDGDGIPDYWELRYGTDMMAQDAGTVVASGSDVTVMEAYQSNLNPWTLEPISGSEPDSPDTTEPVPTEPDGSVEMSWSVPQKRADGSNLNAGEISHYKIFYGLEENNLDMETQDISKDQTSYVIDGLDRGIWFFSIRVYDTNGLASQPSNVEAFQIN